MTVARLPGTPNADEIVGATSRIGERTDRGIFRHSDHGNDGVCDASASKRPLCPVNGHRARGSLAVQATHAAGWNVAGAAVRSLAGMAVMLVLSRLLGPEPFGLLALATVAISLGNLLADSGLTVDLVQRETLTDPDVRTVFTVQLCVGALIAAVLACVAPAISAL